MLYECKNVVLMHDVVDDGVHDVVHDGVHDVVHDVVHDGVHDVVHDVAYIEVYCHMSNGWSRDRHSHGS